MGYNNGTKLVTQYCQKVALSTMPLEGGKDGAEKVMGGHSISSLLLIIPALIEIWWLS